MTETIPARVGVSRVTVRSVAAAAALVWLLRCAASKHAAIHLARIAAVLVVLATLVMVIRLASQFGMDRAALQVTAWGAFALVWAAGAPAALALAHRGRTAQSHAGVSALAQSRGISQTSLWRAEIAACVETLVEIVAVPTAILASIVALFSFRGREVSAQALFGVAIFGIVAALALGIAAGCCRCWGGRYGRFWWLAVVFVPWMLAMFGLHRHGRGWVSIPGFLEQAWRTLTSA